MIEYQHAGQTWKFDPVPANRKTAAFYLAISRIDNDNSAALELVGLLPDVITSALKAHHTPEEIDEFLESITLDLGDPATIKLITDMNMMFIGRQPKPDPVPDAVSGT